MLWAPDGGCVAITDWAGSNLSDLFLVFPARSAGRVNMEEEAHRSFGDMPIVERNDHVYFQAVRWYDPKTLCFKVWGHGDYSPKGFEESFLYTLGGNVTRGCGPNNASQPTPKEGAAER